MALKIKQVYVSCISIFLDFFSIYGFDLGNDRSKALITFYLKNIKLSKCLITFLILLLAMSARGQDAVISGVVEANNKPLTNANILVKRSRTQTTTNDDGTFKITVRLNDTLLVNHLGYKTQLVKIDGFDFLNIKLIEDAVRLEDVEVVVGYGTQKKVNITGAVDNVNLDDVEDRVLTNSSQILQGKIAGANITQLSGQPGEDQTEIRIRGVSSIENNNEPLVIIDGVEGSLVDVNPRDIAQMSVLKDAASASIYGNRAAAGVIVITTKRGGNRLTMNYAGTASWQLPSAFPKGVNASGYTRLYNEARNNSGLPDGFTDEDIAKYDEGTDPQFQSVDWYDRYFAPAPMHNHYVNMRGGQTGKYNFSVSGGYLGQQGVLYGTDNEKITYQARLNTHFFENKLRINTSLLGYGQSVNELTSSTPAVLYNIGYARPATFFKSTEGVYSSTARYIAAHENGGGREKEQSSLRYQAQIQFEPLKGLVLSSLYANNLIKTDITTLTPNYYVTGDALDDIGSLQRSRLSRNFQGIILETFNARLNYSKNIGQHTIGILAGYERIYQKTEGSQVGIYDLQINKPVISLGDVSTLTASGYARERASMSYFGRVNYSFKDRYLLEGNIRKDGSSRFSRNYRWGTFPSFSAGWRISQEKFMDDLTFINELKIRGSWGELGNEGIQTYYASSDIVEPGVVYSFGGTVVPGAAISQLANSATTWETTAQTNLGVDMTLFKRINITADFFHKRTTDILSRVTVPLSLGVTTTPYQNVGEMLNKGWELGIQYRNSTAKKWKYSINVNISRTINEVMNLGEVEFIDHGVITGFNPPGGAIRSQVGYSFGSYYGLIADGIYQIDDFNWQDNNDPSISFQDRDFILKDGLADPSGVMSNPNPGDIKFRDVDNDGYITNDDKRIIGNSIPDYVYSLAFNTSYKNFEVSLLGQGLWGAKAYLMGSGVSPFWNGLGTMLQDVADKRWTPENPSTEHQRFYTDVQRTNIISSYYLQNASYFRLKSLTVGYTFPKETFRNKINDLKVYFTAENLFTITSFQQGFDPERTFNRITSDFHPQVRIFSLGTQLKF